MADQNSSKSKRRRGNIILAAKIACTTAALTPPGIWAWKATDGLREPWPSKAVNVIHTPLPDEKERKAATHKIKERFVDVIAGFHARNGDMELELSETELAYAKDKHKDLEILAESRRSNGFYGVLLYDKTTNRTLLNFSGADVPATLGKMAADIDDMLFEGSGGPVSQTRSALEFAREAEKISRAKTGQGVQFFTGYSLGAYNGYFVAAADILPDAEFFFFEGPGVNTTTIRYCARKFDKSTEQIEQIFRDRCYSYMPEQNLVNTMSQQVGTALTIRNAPCGSAFIPKKHSYNAARVKELGAVETLENRTHDQNSPAIPMAFGIFGLLAIAPWVPSLLRTMRKKKEEKLADELAVETVPASPTR